MIILLMSYIKSVYMAEMVITERFTRAGSLYPALILYAYNTCSVPEETEEIGDIAYLLLAPCTCQPRGKMRVGIEARRVQPIGREFPTRTFSVYAAGSYVTFCGVTSRVTSEGITPPS
jgi:hypothetical protein